MSSLWRTLLRPDHDDDPEKALIATAANILQVGEFQLLQLAYHDWFGKDMGPGDLDRLFAAYMLRNRVTPWMRHYARAILDAHEQGKVDINDPHLHRYDHDYVSHVHDGRRRFLGACLVIALVLIGSIWLGERTASEGGSRFPPYFDRETGER